MYATVDNNSTILFSKDVQTMTLHSGYSDTFVWLIEIKFNSGSSVSLQHGKENVRNDEYSRIANWIDDD